MTDPTRDVVILSGVRTAIGDFGGGLKSVPASELGAKVIAAALARSGLPAEAVGHVFMGQVIPTSGKDAYLARVAALGAGIPEGVPALTVNRLCGSGLQAVISAAQTLALGEADFAIGGGAESMSNAPYHDHGQRWGRKMGDGALVDALVQTLSDPLGGYHMGITAENVASRCGVTRADQDALAVEGHARAVRAITEGRFAEQIIGIEIKTRKGVTVFDTDEHPRADCTLASLAAMRPAFKPDGSVTAGNASGINDGAAALVLGRADAAATRGLTPQARILGWGHAGVAPEVMGLGPVKAVPIALARAEVSLADIDVIEANEAFAAQALAVARELGFDPERLNPNGSGVALGHPVGATGAILTVKAIHELRRIGGRLGLITMCIGGGQGIALVIEAV